MDPTLFPSRGTSARAGDAPAYIRIVARGGAAKVRVDGRTFGFSPQVVRVEPGPHIVSLEGSGDAFLPAQITINAAPDDTLSAVFTARMAPTAVTSDSATTPHDAERPTARPSAPPPAAASTPGAGAAPAVAATGSAASETRAGVPSSHAPPPAARRSDGATSLPSPVPVSPPSAPPDAAAGSTPAPATTP